MPALLIANHVVISLTIFHFHTMFNRKHDTGWGFLHPMNSSYQQCRQYNDE
jgi:hypothetical protein